MLEKIDGAPRKLLAARSYARAGQRLSERWSWSDAEIEAFQRTREYQALLSEIDRVRAAFEIQNPGYSLGVNTQPRSLDVQLVRWNENAGVGRVAQQLYADAISNLASDKYPAKPTPAATERFAAFLGAWRPREAAPLAAPGLSRHGRLRAIDFHVEKDGRIVASTQIADVRSVWEAQGWSGKLRRAVAGTRFVGPLKSPNEPWHYEYPSRDGG